jgi:predicted transcriptional regulator
MGDFGKFVRVALAEHRIRQYALVREAQIAQSRLSKIANGHVQPTPEEKARILDAIERLKAWRMQNPYA